MLHTICNCREVFGVHGVKVFLCFWHVKRSWLKNLHRKCPRAAQYSMFLSLEKIMLMLPANGQSSDSFKQQVKQAVRDFCSQYAQHSEFVCYIQKFYEPKIGKAKPMLHGWHWLLACCALGPPGICFTIHMLCSVILCMQ